MRTLFAGIVAAASVAIATPASAAYYFTLTSSADPTTHTTFQIEDGFTPDASSSSSFTVNVFTQEVTDDSISAAMPSSATFAPAKAVPNFILGKTQYTGSQRLYTGTTSNPTGFVLGDFTLGSFDGEGEALPDSTLSIRSDTIAAVPEPASWAMMMIGFGAVGFAIRRRPTAVARIRFA